MKVEDAAMPAGQEVTRGELSSSFDTPEESSSQYRSQLQRDGVIKIPTVFTKDEICNVRRAVFEALICTRDERKYQDGGHIQWRTVNGKRWPAILFWPALISDDLRMLRQHAGFLDVVRSFLGGSSRQMNNQVYLRLPGDNDAFNIHQDYMFRREVQDPALIVKSYIQTLVAIDRVDARNGAVEFFIGSHNAGLLDLIESDRSNLRSYDPSQCRMLEAKFERVVFELEPGDMLVWNLLVAHGSRSNTSDRMRMTYMNGFCDSAASDAWPMFMNNNHVVDIDSSMIPVRTGMER
jgi:ectoine hydroxylase-related dioxygenase (phytanoyl-CoA dioxygenase family)